MSEDAQAPQEVILARSAAAAEIALRETMQVPQSLAAQHVAGRFLRK
jgi:hypothetical protein